MSRNLMSTNRGNTCLMLNISMHTNCASMAYQSSRLKGVQLEASDIDEIYEQEPHVD